MNWIRLSELHARWKFMGNGKSFIQYVRWYIELQIKTRGFIIVKGKKADYKFTI